MLCVITRHLVAEICGTAEFRLGNHALLMGEGRVDIRRRHAEAVDYSLGEARVATSKPGAQWLRRIQRTEAWLSVLPSTVNGIELGAQEWRDSYCICYGIKKPDLKFHCNGFRSTFSI